MRVHLALAMLPTWLPLGAAIAAPPAIAQQAGQSGGDQSSGGQPNGGQPNSGQHWAFAPLPPRPAPTASDGGAGEIDALVAAQLAAAGLEPSPRADRRTLLRRLSFALTGLPPSPDEVDAFVADPAADAFARAVDRLLASPHYGERQARWWLDLARYSDSNGLDENLAFGDAFRYRDWVVQACNADLPFDRFGTLQIAGDLLDDADGQLAADRHVATGFLALGPRMLAEAISAFSACRGATLPWAPRISSQNRRRP